MLIKKINFTIWAILVICYQQLAAFLFKNVGSDWQAILKMPLTITYIWLVYTLIKCGWPLLRHAILTNENLISGR